MCIRDRANILHTWSIDSPDFTGIGARFTGPHRRPVMRRHSFLFAFLAACSTAAEHADQQAAPAGQAAGTIPAESRVSDSAATKIVRALYVNRWAAQSRRRMAKLIATADSTEINAFVIDMKDEFGLNFKTSNPEFAKNAGHASVANVAALLDTLKAHKIL